MSMIKTKTADVPTDLTEIEFSVGGMTCGSCAARVEKALSHQPGVVSAGVNLASEKATVAFDPNFVNADDLVAAVVKIGYGLTPLKLNEVL